MVDRIKQYYCIYVYARDAMRTFLRRHPLLLNLVAKVYLNLRPYLIAEWFIGTKAREKEWATRSKGSDWPAGENWVMGYWESQSHSHRSFLVDAVASFSPVSSILEIGCNCAPNLYLINQRFPKIDMHGIDINQQAIKVGRQMLASEGISNIHLTVNNTDALSEFSDNLFDLIVTDALLIYIGKDKIYNVIREMLRVARKGLILVEMIKPDSKLGIRHHGLWQRDYGKLLRQFDSVKGIDISKITKDIWGDPNWQEAGAIIKVMK